MKRVLALGLLLSIALAVPFFAKADYIINGLALEKCHVFFDNGTDIMIPINGSRVYLSGLPHVRVKSFVVISKGPGSCYYSADKSDWKRLLPAAEFEQVLEVKICGIPGDPVMLTITVGDPPKPVLEGTPVPIQTPAGGAVPIAESTDTYG